MKDPIVIESAPQPDAAVVLLHGLGADGHDFAPIVNELRLPESCRVRFVLPHAPVQPVTINGGVAMPAWFDILGVDRHAQQDEAGIRKSSAYLDELVDAQMAAGITPERIVMAGFSQGGAIALFTALRRSTPLAGVIGLSTYLPLQPQVVAEHAGLQSSLPVLLVHGTHDPVLPLALAEDACEFISALGYSVQYQTYPMAHQVCMEEITLLRAWLLSQLGES
ncbi:MAG: carboxylesterase [Pseudomonadota bacterium]